MKLDFAVGCKRLPVSIADKEFILRLSSVNSVLCVPKRVLRRALHVGYLCWVLIFRG